MEPITKSVFMVYCHDHEEIVNAAGPGVPKPGLPLSARPGHEVSSYRELMKKIAALSFYNSRFRLLFRGQAQDYMVNHKGDPGVHSSLYPSILRASGGTNRRAALDKRFQTLHVAEELLTQRITDGTLRQHQIMRWAVLQHYEVVQTPLLDVTQSLQTAISFALASNADEGYLFVLAFPQLSGHISVSVESMTQVVDLTQVCPPEALRPHFQAGLLVGDYPTVDCSEMSHGGRGMIGNNFACRLLGKFKLLNGHDWAKKGFVATREDVLFPHDDAWLETLKTIREDVLARI